jgi:hypothetical protein
MLPCRGGEIMYLLNSAPISPENQHYVLCPEADGGRKAEAVYATSPEAAVAMVQEIHRTNDFGESLQDADVSGIRLAAGAELPWNDPEVVVTVVGNLMVAGMTVEEAGHLFDWAPARPATPTEREGYFRAEDLRRDAEGEREFNHGFNVLYKEEVEAGRV